MDFSSHLFIFILLFSEKCKKKIQLEYNSDYWVLFRNCNGGVGLMCAALSCSHPDRQTIRKVTGL